ncbi:MAG: 30S ribosomal protein S17 [Acidimicrobiales bacterium]
MADNEPVSNNEPAPEPEPETRQATEGSDAGVGSSSQRENRRKVREGIVVSTGMEKTAVVAVTERVRHPRYSKTVQRTTKLYVHDGEDEAKTGDRVRVAETRPMSKTKRWRLVEILERAR